MKTKSKQEMGLACAILLAAVVVPRLWARSLLVRYDVLFWSAAGNGFSPTFVAVLAKFTCFCLAIAGLVYLAREKNGRMLWLGITCLSVVGFLTTSRDLLTDERVYTVIVRGNALINSIEEYHKAGGQYPENLQQLASVPTTGLAPERRFFYASEGSNQDDDGPWFNGARLFIGKSAYVVCVPLVPAGTLVYRPDGNYADLKGRPLSHGWARTGID